MNRGLVLALPAIVCLATGCVTTSPRTSLRDVDTMVHQRVGANPHVEPVSDEGVRSQAPAPTARPNLDGVIHADRAVAIALVNNANLRARVEELGIAHADMVQAGLINNPKVHASFRFPSGGGAEGTGSEAGIDLEFLDVLTLPLRKKMAAQQLEQAKLRLSHEILKLAVEVKSAFFAYQATRERLLLRRAVVENMQTSAELGTRQLEAGNITAVELANHRASWQDATVELRNDEAAAAVDLERLAMLMGVQDQGPLTVAPKLPEVLGGDPDLKKLEALALARRWDLLAARREPGVLEDALKLSRLKVFTGMEIGVDSERDFDGSRGIGPDASVPIPIFDRQQASNAKARAELRKSRHALTALEQEVRFEVRSAWTHLNAARKNAETYRTSLLPLRRELVDETLKRYNFMLEGVYHLLESKRNELDAQRSYIESEKMYWTQMAELERAVGGRIPAELMPPARPMESVPTAPAPAEHHHHGGD